MLHVLKWVPAKQKSERKIQDIQYYAFCYLFEFVFNSCVYYGFWTVTKVFSNQTRVRTQTNKNYNTMSRKQDCHNPQNKKCFKCKAMFFYDWCDFVFPTFVSNALDVPVTAAVSKFSMLAPICSRSHFKENEKTFTKATVILPKCANIKYVLILFMHKLYFWMNFDFC